MATENLLMAAVQAGGDRQDLHERIRVHSLAAAESQLKAGAADNDLIDRLRHDPAFPPLDFASVMEPEPVRRPGSASTGRRVPRQRGRADSPALRRTSRDHERDPRLTRFAREQLAHTARILIKTCFWGTRVRPRTRVR